MRFALLLVCFLLSGAAGLVYETLWAQQLSMVFGATELAVVCVLAAYMIGLTLGAAAGGRWSRRVERPLRAYALLELGVALAGLAVPAAVAAAGRLQLLLLRDGAGGLASTTFHLVSAFLVLLLPTGLLGATLPLLARQVVDSEERLGPRVGILYAVNTVGAATGALLSAFELLPALGLARALLVAAGCSLLAGALAALLSRGSPAPAEDLGPGPAAPGSDRVVLLAAALSGCVGFSLEVLWTRLLTHVLGGSLYAFAAMLASFLTGIGLGSALAARLARTPGAARAGLALSQLCVAACSLAAFAAADPLTEALGLRIAQGDAWGSVWLCAATLLPAALGLGAAFPCAVRAAAGSASDAGPASARVYAWNTVGAASGAIAAGLWLLPALRFRGAASAAAAVCLVNAGLLALYRPPRLARLAAAAAAGLVLLACFPVATPWRVLRSSGLSLAAGAEDVESAQLPLAWPGRIVYYGVGRTATVLVSEEGDHWRLTTNGLPESVIQPPGGRAASMAIARWLGLLSLVGQPATRSLLVVGLGGGTSVEDLPASIQDVEVVELEPEVVAANRFLAPLRASDPLADPRLHVRADDARSALRLEGKRFDAIVSQPSHPWTAGAANLFTREFYQLVRERLAPGGVFVQWMGLQFVDEALLRGLVATLTGSFAHVELYQPPPTGPLLLLASDAPLDAEASAPLALEKGGQAFTRLGVQSPEDILAARVLDDDGCRRLAQGAPPNTDAWNRLQTGSPLALRRHLDTAALDQIFSADDVMRHPPASADRLYLVRRLLQQRAPARALRLAVALPEADERRTAFGLIDLATGHLDRGQATLLDLLARGPRGEGGLLGELEQAPASEEVPFALLSTARELAAGQVAPLLQRWAVTNSTAQALLEGWQRLASGDAAGVEGLEAQLAALGPRHPAYRPATRLRIQWREASGDPERAREALELLEPQLALRTDVRDLMLRARLGAQAGAEGVVGASLHEVVRGVEAQHLDAVAKEALALLGRLPADAKVAELRRRFGVVAASGRRSPPASPGPAR